MLPKLHYCLVVLHLPSLPTPQHLYQHYELGFDGGHAVQHVQHETSCDCQPLYDCMEQLDECLPVVVHKESDPHL